MSEVGCGVYEAVAAEGEYDGAVVSGAKDAGEASSYVLAEVAGISDAEVSAAGKWSADAAAASDSEVT